MRPATSSAPDRLASSSTPLACPCNTSRSEVLRPPFESNQYTSVAFGRRLEAEGLLGSMGSVGDCFDNAAMESFFATLQTELLDRQSWQTISQLRTAIFEFIATFYNRRRRHSSLDYLSPAEYEPRYNQQQATA